MAKKISKTEALINDILESLRQMDEYDLGYMKVTAQRIALPVLREGEVAEQIEDTVPDVTEDEEFAGFDEEPTQEAQEDNSDDFTDVDFNDAEDQAEDGGEDLNFEEEGEFETPSFEDEEPKPVSRRTQREAKPEPKPKAQPKPKAKPEPEYELVDIPGKRLELSDVSEDKTRAELGNKLKEIGVSVKTMPEGTKTSKEDLLKGIRMIYSSAYGKKPKSLDAMIKLAHKNGIDFAPRKGNRADALKVQMYVVALLNKGAIDWPGYSA